MDHVLSPTQAVHNIGRYYMLPHVSTSEVGLGIIQGAFLSCGQSGRYMDAAFGHIVQAPPFWHVSLQQHTIFGQLWQIRV